jgi:hypothetical protein
MKWPFMLKSTHEHEVVRLTQDFARNIAGLEAALRARGAFGPPALNRVELFTVERLVQLLGSGALHHAAAGRPVFQMMALRAEDGSPVGCVTAVLAGHLSDSDMRRFRMFVCGMAQDGSPRERLTVLRDNLGTEDPANE